MSKSYRVIVQSFDTNKPKKILSEEIVLEEEITKPTDCFNLTIGLPNQLNLLQGVQDFVLPEKAALLNTKKPSCCPSCNNNNMMKFGKQKSFINDVFTDHEVTIQRMKCHKCGHEIPSTVSQIFGSPLSGDLKQMQATLGAKFTYRDSEKILDLFSMKDRKINNHDRVKGITEEIGNALESVLAEEQDLATAPSADELILSVDGGHVNTIEDQRSIEAMTSVIYRPEAIRINKKGTRNHLTSKSCAASVRSDGGKQIIANTIIAALKQGLTNQTKLTALCDGADNCWNVVDAVGKLSGSVCSILDWFHIGMKMKNISLPEPLKTKLIRVKWHLWRGKGDRALIRLEQLVELAKHESHKGKIKKFATYIINNKDRIVDYRERQKNGMPFTSNLAESTVESLINQRCKGQQHMRWSRDGLNPVLQIRSMMSCNDEWGDKVKMAILGA